MLLCTLEKTELQDIVCFLGSVEKKIGDTYSKYNGSNKKMRERIAKVNLVWMKYFAPQVDEEEEPTMNSDE